VHRDTGIEYATQFLDNVIPLRDASHAEVVRYTIEIPMRYAECFAILENGRKVGLTDRRRFIGWLGSDDKRSFLFRKNLLHIELRTDAQCEARQPAPGQVQDIILKAGTRTIRDRAGFRAQPNTAERKFIGVDGSQVTFPGRLWTSIKTAGPQRQ
jgi:hypothetical protein